MSLGQAQEIYEIMLKIDEILNGINAKLTVIQTDTPKVAKYGREIRQLELSLMRISFQLIRISGSAEIDNAVRKVLQLIRIIRYLQYAMMAVNMASGPIGWISAAASVGAFSLALMPSGSSLEGY